MDEKITFKIHRDAQKRPTVTVCTIQINGMTGTGIAIRSLHDNPVEKLGRAKAYGRAKKALIRKESGLPVFRHEAYNSLMSYSNNLSTWAFKSQYKCEEEP